MSVRRTVLKAAALPSRGLKLTPEIVLWLIVALAFVTIDAPRDIWLTISQLRVPDTDDAMRLAGVRDLVAGQSWFDNVQHRFLSPGAVPSHWSRLVDAPLAGLILVLTPLVGQSLAEGLTAAFWPPLLLILYGVILYRGVRARFGTQAALLAVLIATQTFGLIVQSRAGRVDHHALQILAVIGIVLCLVRGGARAGAVAGALAALSLAIGLEGLPSIAVAALIFVGEWVVRGRPVLPALLGFGLALGAITPVLFAIQTAPALWAATACDALSPPWLWLAGGGACVALASMAADRHLTGWSGRAALVAMLGITVVGGFALLFPICLGGPFPGMPILVRDKWLLVVNEMSSVPKFVAKGQWEVLVYFAPLVLATLAATWNALRGPVAARRYFGIGAPFLWLGLIIGWTQFRGTYAVAGLIPLVAGPVVHRAFTTIADARARPARRIGLAMLATGLVSTVWMAPALLAASFETDARKSEQANAAIDCVGPEAVSPLAALPAGPILAPIAMGPSILLRTPHSVVAAPYHRAIAGLTAAIEGLGGTEADLRRHVDALGITYLVTCPNLPGLDLLPETAFATRLTRGETTAPWLEPLTLAGRLKAWRVR